MDGCVDGRRETGVAAIAGIMREEEGAKAVSIVQAMASMAPTRCGSLRRGNFEASKLLLVSTVPLCKQRSEALPIRDRYVSNNMWRCSTGKGRTSGVE